jgi:hypothetical protein
VSLASLIVDYAVPDPPRALAGGTPRAILEATVEAKLGTRDPSIVEIAAAGNIPAGTIKAARTRIDGLREAMETIDRGPRLDFPEDEEDAYWVRWWHARTPRQREAWIAAVCANGLHRWFDDNLDETGEQDCRGFLEHVPARTAFESLWSADAWFHVSFLDFYHRIAVGEAPAWWEAA